MSFFAPNWAVALSLLPPADPVPRGASKETSIYRVLAFYTGVARGTSSATLPASGGLSGHASMGFFGVKKRHPYPW